MVSWGNKTQDIDEFDSSLSARWRMVVEPDVIPIPGVRTLAQGQIGDGDNSFKRY